MPEIKKVRILLADDHALFRSGMKYLLDGLDGDVEVIEAENYQDAIKYAEEDKNLNMALVDLAMPGFENFTGLKRLCRELVNVPVVVVSALGRNPEISKAMACGASGYIPKTLESSAVLEALQLVFSNGVYLPPNFYAENKSSNGTDFNHENVAKMTPRQQDVLALVACGYSNKEIAQKLRLAEGTVKLHVTALLKALDVSNRTSAVVKANALGLTPYIKFEENVVV